MANSANRGIAEPTVIILGLAIVILTIATGAILAADAIDRTPKDAPDVGPIGAEFISHSTENTTERLDGYLTLTHNGEEQLHVSNLKITIDATDICGHSTTITELPILDEEPDSQSIGATSNDEFLLNIENAHPMFVTPEIQNNSQNNALHQQVYSPDDKITVQFEQTHCEIQDGDPLGITITHRPTSGIIADGTVIATAEADS